MSKSHRHSILQLGTSHFDHISELFSFSAESIGKCLYMLYQNFIHIEYCKLDSSRVGIIGRLRTIYMVIGVAVYIVSFFEAKNFQSTVSDYLVSIHVHRSTSSSLEHVYRELVMELTINDLMSCFFYGGTYFFRDYTKGGIGLNCCQFYKSKSTDELRIIIHFAC